MSATPPTATHAQIRNRLRRAASLTYVAREIVESPLPGSGTGIRSGPAAHAGSGGLRCSSRRATLLGSPGGGDRQEARGAHDLLLDLRRQHEVDVGLSERAGLALREEVQNARDGIGLVRDGRLGRRD